MNDLLEQFAYMSVQDVFSAIIFAYVNPSCS